MILLVLSLVGCNTKGLNNKIADNPTEIGGKAIIYATISKVGKDMLDVRKPHKTYNQKNSTELLTLVEAIQRAKKVKGVVDVTAPDYLLILTFKDKTMSKYSLWLGEESGAIMNEKDTHTIYTLPPNLIAKLNKYVK